MSYFLSYFVFLPLTVINTNKKAYNAKYNHHLQQPNKTKTPKKRISILYTNKIFISTGMHDDDEKGMDLSLITFPKAK